VWFGPNQRTISNKRGPDKFMRNGPGPSGREHPRVFGPFYHDYPPGTYGLYCGRALVRPPNERGQRSSLAPGTGNLSSTVLLGEAAGLVGSAGRVQTFLCANIGRRRWGPPPYVKMGDRPGVSPRGLVKSPRARRGRRPFARNGVGQKENWLFPESQLSLLSRGFGKSRRMLQKSPPHPGPPLPTSGGGGGDPAKSGRVRGGRGRRRFLVVCCASHHLNRGRT